MILYDYFRSGAAYRVRIAMNLKGLTAERRYIHLRRGEQRAPDYLALNPQGFVPLLVVGDRRIAQSLAIIEYLEERHPHPPLLPTDAEDRAWVRSIALAIACDLHPLNNLRVLQHLSRKLEVDEAGRDEWYRHWVREGLGPVEAMLAARPGKFCFGDTPTIADACLVPQVFNARRMEVDMTPYPRVAAVYDKCVALPAFADAQPSKQPDAE